MPDAGNDRYRSGLVRLAVPLVISFWVREAFALVDTVYASTFPRGEAAIAAIGLTSPYRLLMIACWVGTSSGLTSHLSSAIGAREGQRVDQLLRASLKIVVVLCLVFLALAAWIWLSPAPPGRDSDLHRDYRIYATMLLGGMGVTAFWSVLPDSIIKAHHDTKSTMWAGLLAGVTNVVLNTVFVFVFRWGIFGIALATVLARVASLAYATHRARQHERARRAAGGDTAPGRFERPVLPILGIAFPAAVTFALMAFETKIVYGILEGLDDAVAAVAAWSVFDQAVRFMSMPVIAASAAMLPLVARLWGQRNVHGVRVELRTASLLTVAYVLVFVTPLALALGPWISARLCRDPAARAHLALGLRLLPLAVVAVSPSFFLRSTFEGLQRPRPALVVAILRTAVLVVPLVWLGVVFSQRAGHAGIEGAYAGYLGGTLLATLGLAVWVRAGLGPLEERSSPAARGSE